MGYIHGTMPDLPRSGCSHPLCPKRSEGHGLCADHARAKALAFDKQRGTSSARGYDAEWRRVRDRQLRASPYCVVCNAIATDVDHEPRYISGTSHNDYILTSMCHVCHARRTSKQVR